MKKLDAHIKPCEWQALKSGLLALGVDEILVIEERRVQSSIVRREVYRGMEVAVDYIDELEVELVLNDGDVAAVLATIQTLAPEARAEIYHLDHVVDIGEPGAVGGHDQNLRVAS